MAIKFRKLIMLSILFPLGLGTGLSSGVNVLSMPTKEAVSYANSEDLNDHDTNHSSDYNWTSLQSTDVSTGGTLTGGDNESAMAYYYLEDNVELSTTLNISKYVTLCLNGKYIDGNSKGTVISLSSGSYFNLCDCSEDGSGTIKSGNTEFGGGVYVRSSTFNMYGGTITDNTAPTTGGGVYVTNNSTFNLYDGTISGNTGYSGGGVGVAYDAKFNMYGGSISYNTATGNGGGVYVGMNATFNMYGDSISYNKALYGSGGGVQVHDGATFNMYDGTISDNTASVQGGGVENREVVNMYNGTIVGNVAANGGDGLYNRSGDSGFSMYGGYFNNNMYRNTGIVSIKGGYFSSTGYDSVKDYIDSNYTGIDISTLGTDLDENYVVGYPYAVYKTYTITDPISSVEFTYGTTYTPNITDNYTSVAYTWKDAGNIIVDAIVGFPTDVGEYIVTAYFLYTTVEDDITTNYYFTGNEFTVTIHKGQAAITADATQSKTYDGSAASVDYIVTVGDINITADATVTETWYDESDEVISAPTEVGTYKVSLTVADTTNYDGTSIDVIYTITENTSSSTPSDEEDGTDNNSSDGGTTTSTDSTGLSAGAIAGIVIASVFVVGLIAFLVYFFVFRKKKAKKEEKKSSKKTKK